jgi:hypothetical protein
VPTTEPTVIPSAVPSWEPSTGPTELPSAVPTAQPTVSPSAAPTVIPTVAPTVEPSASPTFEPSSSPTVLRTTAPTTVPTAGPTQTPSQSPTTGPTAPPTVLPSAGPTPAPTHVPTVVPTEGPTCSPSAAPSEAPTKPPTTEPSTVPTTVPTAAPSSGPTAGPTLKPTAVPSVAPTAAPTVAPTKAPTARPSLAVGATAGPSRAPTAAPSLSIEGVWKVQVNAALTIAANAAPATASHRSTYYELDVASSTPSAVYGSCANWRSFLSGELSTASISYRPMTLQLLVTDDVAKSPSLIECSDATSVKQLLSSLTSAASASAATSVTCAGHTWAVSKCGTNSIPAMCVDCVDPCASATHCGGGSGLSAVSPCVTQSCSAGSLLTSAVRLLSVNFQEPEPAPSILSRSVSANKTELAMSLRLSTKGAAYCAAYLLDATGTSFIPTSASNIVLQNFMAATDRANMSTVVISGLQGAASYKMYCFAQSASGARTAVTDMVAAATTVRTACCKMLQVQSRAASVTEGQVVSNFLAVSTPYAPLQPLQGTVMLTNTASGAPVAAAVYPSTFTFTPAQGGTSGPSVSIALAALPAGIYTYTVTLTGATAAEYSVEYASTNTLTVVAVGRPLPAPVLTTAQFSDDGSYVAVAFDSNTDRGKLSTRFPCNALFTFACATTSSCLWTSSREVRVYLDSSTGCAAVQSPLSVDASTTVLKAQCQSTSCETTSWPAADASTVLTIAAPASAIAPTVSVSAPSTIGDCDSLMLDVSASSGSGGREWASYAVTAETTATDSTVAELQTFLQTYHISPPAAIPAMLLSAGSSYTFSVKLCNFLGKFGTSSKKVVVQTSAVPSVSLPGPALRTITRSTVLSILSDASYTDCGGARARSGLSYLWTVKQSGLEQTSLGTLSKDPSVMKLLPYSLQVNSLFEFILQVTKVDSLQTAAASVQVFVAPGNLRAVIAQGTVRSVRAGEVLTIDASASADEDVPELRGNAADLSFEWSCAQTLPALSATCADVLGAAAAELLHTGIFSADALASAAGSAVSVTVTVRDASQTRSATSTVSVTVTPSLAPVLTLVSDVASSGVFNANNELHLAATVQVPAQYNASLTWSVDDESGFSLIAATKSPLTLQLPASNQATLSTVYLVLRAGSLPGSSALTFTLTVAVPSAAQLATTSTTVRVNAPPLPGKFLVSPPNGTEIVDPFTFSAPRWFDNELPLTYQFAQLASSGAEVALGAKTQSSFLTSTLTAGLQAEGYVVTCTLTVFDALSASNRAIATTKVFRGEARNATALASVITDSISSAGSSATGLRQSTSVASYLLNAVDCSGAPACAALNRKACYRTPNTCGECVSGLYVGDAGDSNQACVLKSEIGRVDADTCTTSADCGPFSTCVDGACKPVPMSCPGNCSFPHGTCAYVDTNLGTPVDTCFAGDASCTATCDCQAEYAGSSTCSLTIGELAQKQELRAQVIAGIERLVALEDADPATVSSWIASLVESAQAADELTAASAAMLLSVADTIMQSAVEVGLPPEALTTLLKTVDSVAQWRAHNVRRRRRLSLTTTTSNADDTSDDSLAQLQKTLATFQSLTSDKLVPGQDSVALVLPQFRVLVQKLSLSQGVGDLTVTQPVSSLETLSGGAQSGVTLPRAAYAGADSMSVALTSLRAELFNSQLGLSGTEQICSSPLSVSLSGAAADCEGAECRVELTLQASTALAAEVARRVAPELHNTSCPQGDRSAHEYSCADGTPLHVQCGGEATMVVSRCPVIRHNSVCNAVTTDGVASSGCTVVSQTDTTVTCSCPLSAISGARRLTGTDDSQSEVDVSYAAMLTEVKDTFLDTVISSQGLNAQTLEKGWSAVVTVGTLVAAVLVGLYWSNHADAVMSKINPDKKGTVDATAAPAVWSGRLSFLSGVFAQHRRTATLPEKRINKDLQLAEEALPVILRSSSLTSRVKDEMKHHHKWFGIVFFYSSSFPRVLRVLSLATNVTIMLFVQSITYSLTNPDDGSCETYNTQTGCAAEPSPYATGASKCYWDANTERCALVQPDSNVRVILFVAIFSALLTTPLAVGIEWIIMFLLAPPTKSSTQSIASGSNSPTSSSRARSLFSTLSTSQPASPVPYVRSLGSTSGDDADAGVSLASASMEEGTRSPTTTSPRHSARASSPRGKRTGLHVGSVVNLLAGRGTVVGEETEEQRKVTEIAAQAQSDLRKLVEGITAYRADLTSAEKVEFDGKDSSTCYLSLRCLISNTTLMFRAVSVLYSCLGPGSKRLFPHGRGHRADPERAPEHPAVRAEQQQRYRGRRQRVAASSAGHP